MRGLALPALAPLFALLLMAGPLAAEAPAGGPKVRPGVSYSTAAAQAAAALSATTAATTAEPPRANPRGARPAAAVAPRAPAGPPGGVSLATAALGGGVSASRLGIPAVAQAPALAALLAPGQPRARPDTRAAAPPQAVAPQAAAVGRIAALPPLRPLPRPALAAMPVVTPRAASAAPVATERFQQAAFVTPVSPDVLTTRRGALCGLATLQGRRIAPVAARVKGCGIADPVEVTAVDGVPLSQPATIDCGTAVALDRWVKTGLKRALGGQGGGLARIQIAGSYTCRPMNNIRGNKISEHGRGRAIDVSGVVLKNGQSLSIARDWRKPVAAFLRAAHRSACGIFGTTLGPGSDGYHEDHLHFDTAVHRQPYCR